MDEPKKIQVTLNMTENHHRMMSSLAFLRGWTFEHYILWCTEPTMRSDINEFETAGIPLAFDEADVDAIIEALA